MPIPPCFQGTCSNDMTYDPITGLSVSTRLSPSGSIACDPEANPNGGLYVEVAGLTADETSGVAAPCGQSLGREPSGNLFAFPEGAIGKAPDSSTQSTGGPDEIVAVNGTNGSNSFVSPNVNLYREDTFVNPFSCEAWAYFTIHEAKIIGSRPALPIDNNGFYVVANGYVDFGVSPGLVSNVFDGNERQDFFGYWSPNIGGDPDYQSSMQRGWNMHKLFRISAGGTVRVRSHIQVIHTHRFNMVSGDLNGGIALQHTGAVFWRHDTHPTF